MGRFSDVLAKEGINPAASPAKSSQAGELGYPSGLATPEASSEDDYLVYNGNLGSPSKGVKYRRSPDLKDTMRIQKMANFGEVVHGIPTEEGSWLQVGKLFLPMEVQGVPVLVPTSSKRAEEDEDPADMWKKWKMPTPLPLPPDEQGSGTLYEVMHDKIVGRPAPSTNAPMQVVRSRGNVIELFEFDETRRWRVGLDDKTFHRAWFLIDHADLGPLLRPQGQPFSVKPMEPLCVAASENLSHDLQRFIDEGGEPNIFDASGRTPLMLAAECDNLECCVLLVEGGADPSLRSTQPCAQHGKCAVEMCASTQTKALLKAICGYKEFDMRRLDQATESLGRDYQETVDRLLEAAGRAVAKGLFLVEGQEPAHPDQEAEVAPEPAPPTPRLPQHLPSRSISPERDSRTSPAEAFPGGGRDHYLDVRVRDEDLSEQGVLHEVVFSAVWIRKEATVDAAKIAVRKKGELVELFESDVTGDWARVEHEMFAGHFVTGWMLIRHPSLGMLLKPAKPDAQTPNTQELS